MSYTGNITNARIVSSVPPTASACSAPTVKVINAQDARGIAIPGLPSSIYTLSEDALLELIDLIVEPETPTDNLTAVCNLRLQNVQNLAPPL